MRQSALDADVVVIGAGAAGLAAARHLLRKKRSVIVLESRDRIGGRAHTTVGPFGFPYDIGAQWLEAPRTFRGFMARNALVAEEGEVDDRYFVNGNEVRRCDVKRANTKLQKKLDTVTVADRSIACAIKGIGRGDPAYAIAIAELGPLSVGLDITRISTIDYNEQPNSADRLFKKGYGAAVTKWAEGVPVLTGRPVSRVAWNDDGVAVTAGKKVVRTRAAVITVPIGVLKTRSITFAPPLPEKHRKAIDGLQMANLEKVSILFRNRVCKPGAAHAGFYVLRRGRAMYALWSRSGRFVTCFFGDKEARHICRLDRGARDYALQELSEGLKSILLLSSIKDLAKCVERSHVTHWGTDPCSRGSYSAAKVGHSESRKTLAIPVERRLFFAGEATCPAWAARVYGAYSSGKNAACLVDEALGKAPRPRRC
jgi:monoamine oxidase